MLQRHLGQPTTKEVEMVPQNVEMVAGEVCSSDLIIGLSPFEKGFETAARDPFGYDDARVPATLSEKVFPGDLTIASPLGRDLIFQALLKILHSGWSEVESADLVNFRLKATMFHSFVPVRVQMCVYANIKAPAAESLSTSLVVLRDLGRTDVVRFHDVSKMITDRLGGFEPKACLCGPCSPTDIRSESMSTTEPDDFDDFDDDEDFPLSSDDDESATQHVSAVAMLFLDALDSKDSFLRTAACQALARRAQCAPGCHTALAEMAVRHQRALRRALGFDSDAPAVALEAAFPLAAAIHMASTSAAAAVLLSQCVGLAPDATRRVPSQPRLVHEELVKAFQCVSALDSAAESESTAESEL